MADRSSAHSAVPAAVRARISAEYDKAGFFGRYGQDLWLVVIVSGLVLTHVFRYQMLNFYHTLRANWLEHRYNPLYMPIAGHVHRDPGETPAEATSKNFMAAVTKIINELVKMLMIPLTLLMAAIMALFEALVAAINAIRAMFDKLRNMAADILQDVMGRILSVMVGAQHYALSMQDLFHKLAGAVATSAFVGTGGFFASFSAMLYVVYLIVIILIEIAASMVVFIALLFFAPEFAVPALALDTIIFILILIPLIIVKAILDGVHDSHRQFFDPSPSSSPPHMPTCFGGDVSVPVCDARRRVRMRDLRIGDELESSGRVTATMKLLARGQDVHMIGGVVVTGNHSVLHPTKGWIPCREHEDASPLPAFRDEFVYCVNTTTKRVFLGGHTFGDWDDLDEDDYVALSASEAPLPPDFLPEDVQRCLTTSYRPGAQVAVTGKVSKDIRDVRPGDKLMGETTCVGTVRLEAVGGGARHHLIVDARGFMLDGWWVHHYDHAIEQYLGLPQPQLFI